jgi:hypothetical protein
VSHVARCWGLAGRVCHMRCCPPVGPAQGSPRRTCRPCGKRAGVDPAPTSARPRPRAETCMLPPGPGKGARTPPAGRSRPRRRRATARWATPARVEPLLAPAYVFDLDRVSQARLAGLCG